MENKVLVEIIVPVIEQNYDLYLPINKKIGNIINLIEKAINEFNEDAFGMSPSISLYNSYTGVKYDNNEILRKTDIRNGSKLVLM